MKKFTLALATLVAVSVCGMAMAQKAGSFSASIGVTRISPSIGSGDLSAPSLPGTQVGVSNNTQLTDALNYMLSDNIALHLPIGFDYKHDVTGAGASYVKFYSTNGTGVLTAITNPGGPGTGVSFESKLSPTVQLGAIFNLNENGMSKPLTVRHSLKQEAP